MFFAPLVETVFNERLIDWFASSADWIALIKEASDKQLR